MAQPLSVEPSMEVKDFLLNGLPEREDFDAWISDWEANRQDRVLPFKENS